MDNKKIYREIEEKKMYIKKFEDVSRRFPLHEGYKQLVRQLQQELADLSSQLYKKES